MSSAVVRKCWKSHEAGPKAFDYHRLVSIFMSTIRDQYGSVIESLNVATQVCDTDRIGCL